MPASDWRELAIALLALSLFLLIAELLRKRGWSGEHTRRFVHIGVGLYTAGLVWLFTSPLPLYLLGGLFLLGNGFMLRKGLLKGIHDIGRPSFGTVTFPLSLLVVLPFTWNEAVDYRFILTPIYTVLALADPFASFVGELVGSPEKRIGRNTKSVAGSLAFWAITLLILGTWYSSQQTFIPAPIAGIGWIVAVATVLTAVEALGGRGWDNLFIVVAGVLLLRPGLTFDVMVGTLAIAVGVAILFGVLAVVMKVLDAAGAIATGLMGISLWVAGGWLWVAPALVFFVTASAWSRFGKSRKADAALVVEKGSRRDAGQVYANGGIAWACAIGHLLWPHEAWLVAAIGSFAAANADTWATEVGGLSRSLPRMITTWKKVEPGTSGGMTLIGTIAGIWGAVVVAMTARLGPADAFWLIVLSGILGGLVDSLLGATIQAGYNDPKTGKMTEQPLSDGKSLSLVKGWRWVNNDRVNAACTAIGALLAAFFYLGSIA